MISLWQKGIWRIERMPEKISDTKPPRGLARLAFRLPIWLYRLKLGWILGNRFMLLHHIGRKSGRPRQTVLEVVRYDKASGTYVVAAGFGVRSDWYQNIMANPHVMVDSGGRHMQAIAERLPPEAAEEELVDYNRRYPSLMKELARIMGYRLDGTEDDVRALGRILPIVALKPEK
jgi:deazaflavin-dependent oxidoreductase (nitroreductase family)